MNVPKRWQRSRQVAQPPELKIKYCGRPTIYGNPFEIGYFEYGGHTRYWTRHDVVGLHAASLDIIIAQYHMTAAEYLLPLLEYDYLSCWCGLDQECHVDNLIYRLERFVIYKQDTLFRMEV